MLRDRNYVRAICEERSFSRAAQKLFITQPALSNKIKRLEEQLGEELFDRSVTPLRLTQAGLLYMEAAEKVGEIEKQLREDIRAISEKRSGGLSVGGSTYFCSYVLPALATEFETEYPGYTVSILDGNTEDLNTCLQSGVIDLAINVDSMDETVFNGILWGTEELILAVPARQEINKELFDYRLTYEGITQGTAENQIPRVDLKYFEGQQFLFMKKGNDCYQRAMDMCQRAGFQPNIRMCLDQMLTSYHVANSGYGSAFIRADILDHTRPTNDLYFYRLKDEAAHRNICLYYKKKNPLTAIQRDFINFLMARSLDANL